MVAMPEYDPAIAEKIHEALQIVGVIDAKSEIERMYLLMMLVAASLDCFRIVTGEEAFHVFVENLHTLPKPDRGDIGGPLH